jgi:hypothetical protein
MVEGRVPHEIKCAVLVWLTPMEGCDIHVGTPLEFGTFLPLGVVKLGFHFH